jgi:glycogen debranching enzyme
VEVCARHLLTSFGLRSLAPSDPAYCGRCIGDQQQRDGAITRGRSGAGSWGRSPSPTRVHGDPRAAGALLEPMAPSPGRSRRGSIAEIFDGDAPFVPRGCVAQAWSVAETLRAWQTLTDAPSAGDAPRRRSPRPRVAERRRNLSGLIAPVF